jgi:hypothetical protein
VKEFNFGSAFLRFALFTLVAAGLAGAVVCESVFAAGGADGGGGGKGILCDGKLRTLDLYEAEEIHHLHISRDLPDIQSALDMYYPKLLNFTAYEFFHNGYNGTKGVDLYQRSSDDPAYVDWGQLKSVVTDRFMNIPEGQHLPFTPDATLPQLPPNCKAVQILVLDGPGAQLPGFVGWDGPPKQISRDMYYWKMLSPTDQAALMLHEFLYDIQGLRNGANSDDVRLLIGLVFSDQELVPLRKPMVEQDPSDFLSSFGCGYAGQDIKSGKDIQRGAYSLRVLREIRDGKSGIGIYFERLNGITQIFHTSAFLPGKTVKEANTSLIVHTKAESQYSGKTYNIEVNFHVHDDYARAGAVALGRTSHENPDFSIRAWRENEKPPEFWSGPCYALP